MVTKNVALCSEKKKEVLTVTQKIEVLGKQSGM
jgi:hypothetical protein